MKDILLPSIALLGIIILIFLLSRAEYGTIIEPQFDRTDTPLNITIYTYENRGKLMQALNTKERVRGQAFWYEKPENPNECTIHVLEPNRVDGDITTSWGHELMHCVYGSYHE